MPKHTNPALEGARYGPPSARRAPASAAAGVALATSAPWNLRISPTAPKSGTGLTLARTAVAPAPVRSRLRPMPLASAMPLSQHDRTTNLAVRVARASSWPVMGPSARRMADSSGLSPRKAPWAATWTMSARLMALVAAATLASAPFSTSAAPSQSSATASVSSSAWRRSGPARATTLALADWAWT